MVKPDNELIAELALILTGKQVESAVIQESLTLVCRNFLFDGALVYEIDQHNYFNLKESKILVEMNIQKNFHVNEISPGYRKQLSEENLTYVVKTGRNTANEQEMLALFPAESFVLTSIIDDNDRVSGMIVFLQTARAKKISSASLQKLSVLLSMLGKYVGIRIYRNKLEFAQSSLETILDNTGIDVYVNDFYTHDILYVNKSMAAPYGGVSHFIGNKCWQVLFPGQSGPCSFCPEKKLIDENGNPTEVYSWDYQRAFDGSWFRVFSAAFRWKDGRLAHLVSSADITGNKRNEELVQYMANYDSLTGLPNRRKLVSDCERRINNIDKDESASLLFFDIDGFKSINDNFGHDAGDEFLIKLGEFFTGIPMLKNAIYRNGGDEFVALLDKGITELHIRSLAGFIHERFTKPWVLKGGEVHCNISIGVASYPKDGTKAEELVNQADQAMYKVKKAGGAGICFT